ncbi:MAG: M48 family metalloprotease [Pseudomonadota bacterium]
MKQLFLFILCTFLILPFSHQANAQTVIRDTEIELYLSEWFAPIFQANGMQPEQVNVILVQSNQVNAFVAGGSNIFLYTGLIEKTDHPGELIGVMAHELGHITAGHLVRGREALEQASYESILGAIIGIGAAVAAGDAGGVAAGSLAGGSVAQRRFLATSRTFENSADQAAVQSMERAGMSPEGLLTFMQKLQGQELLPTSQQSEYIRTHPLTRDRVESLQAKVDTSDKTGTPFPAEWMEQHKRMIAKLTGFINSSQVAWAYDDRDQSVPAVYARSIAAYRQNELDESIKLINQLITKEPKNAYFHELKGQMLMDYGRVEESLPSYERALALAPQSGLIRTALAHAQIESARGDKGQYQMAVENLKRAARDEPRSTRVHRLLATAYGRLDQDSMARLHLAEEAILQRKDKYARQQAKLALEGLEKGSAAALRANDIITFSRPNKS